VIKQVPFTQVYNLLLEDPSISYKAKGLFAYIQSKPSNWEYYIKDLVNHSKDGKDSVLSGLRELERAGYLKRSIVRGDNGRTTHSDYILSYDKEFNEGGKSECGFTAAENPNAENPPYSNTKSLSNIKQSNITVLSDEKTGESSSVKKNKYSEEFEKFWKFYKVGNKYTAYEKFRKLSKSQLTEMYSRVRAYVESTNTNGVYPSRKNCETYLNKKKEYWNDAINDQNTRKPLPTVARVTQNTGAFAR